MTDKKRPTPPRPPKGKPSRRGASRTRKDSDVFRDISPGKSLPPSISDTLKPPPKPKPPKDDGEQSD